MLAGRKLLLADDSATIQKVIELTFADEGVRVVAFGNGDAAIEHLDEVAPDVVLADIFMPGKSGYEVCKYIKQNEKLKHIPVMLLVGSFEPFDEAEARKVGADDILTKPFQSIRRLIDRVGSLVGRRPEEEEEVPTAELPDQTPDERFSTEQKLNTEDLAIATADTQPLPPELQAELEKAKEPASATASVGEHRMEQRAPEMRQDSAVESDSLLDLGEFEVVNAAASDEFVLDLDVEEEFQNGSESYSGGYETSSSPRSFVEPALVQAAPPQENKGFEFQPAAYVEATEPYRASEPESVQQSESVRYEEPEVVAYEDQVHELAHELAHVPEQTVPLGTAPETSAPAATPLTADSLSPEMIDAIARRAVEMLSEKVVREIAWEVVPELAELLIKKQLDEKESQHK